MDKGPVEEEPDTLTEHDSEQSNVAVRAGFIRGMAARATNTTERLFLFRAARSLMAFADLLGDRERDRHSGG